MKKEYRDFIKRELEACDELEYNGFKVMSCSYCVRDFKRIVKLPNGTYKEFNNYQEALEVLVNGGGKE